MSGYNGFIGSQFNGASRMGSGSGMGTNLVGTSSNHFSAGTNYIGAGSNHPGATTHFGNSMGN